MMIRKMMVCDRCGKVVSTAYRIEAFPVDADENEGEAFPLSEDFTDLCEDCLNALRNLTPPAETPEPLPSPAPKKRRGGRKAIPPHELHQMVSAGMTLAEIAEKTGLKETTVFTKLKGYTEHTEEDTDADSED